MNNVKHNFFLLHFFKIVGLFLFFLLLIPINTQAANFFFTTDKQQADLGATIKIKVLVDTENEDLNAFAGELTFSKQLELKSINTGNSLISLWLEEPTFSSFKTIPFSGIIPGGLNGQGQLFEISFIAKSTGQAEINISQGRALINDGTGQDANLITNKLTLDISDLFGAQDVVIVDLTDNTPPENFAPIITQIPDISADDYLLVFYAQDKQSGVNYYEIKEGNLPKKIITSPYLLENQSLDQDIIITAVDKSGNRREQIIKLGEVETKKIPYLPELISAIIIIGLFFIIWRYKKRKNRA